MSSPASRRSDIAGAHRITADQSADPGAARSLPRPRPDATVNPRAPA